MTKIEAWKAEDGTIHETQESARNADSRLEYAGRVNEFLCDSPLMRDERDELERWLLSNQGYNAVLRLAGRDA